MGLSLVSNHLELRFESISATKPVLFVLSIFFARFDLIFALLCGTLFCFLFSPSVTTSMKCKFSFQSKCLPLVSVNISFCQISG